MCNVFGILRCSSEPIQQICSSLMMGTSWKTVEKCGGILENTVYIENDNEPIRRYWIDNLD